MDILFNISLPKYQQAFYKGELEHYTGLSPLDYFDTMYRFNFRFPFPDEENLPFGKIKGHENRYLPVLMERGEVFRDVRFDQGVKFINGRKKYFDNPNNGGEKIKLWITAQRLILKNDGKFVVGLVLVCPYCKCAYVVDTVQEIFYIARQIQENHFEKLPLARQKIFWQKVTVAIKYGNYLAI